MRGIEIISKWQYSTVTHSQHAVSQLTLLSKLMKKKELKVTLLD